MVDLVWWGHGLPFPTIFLASAARRIGGFGLVPTPFTNRYQVSILGAGLPCGAFTNHYHRDEGTR